MRGASQASAESLAEACDAGGAVLPHLYLALIACGHSGEGRPMPGTSAAIWQAIDRLRDEGGRAAEIHILEQLSIEVHRLGFVLKQPYSETIVRRRISALTGEWLGVARLCA